MRRSFLFPLPALLLLVVSVLPLALGSHTLFMRDIFNSHLPMKASNAEALRVGYLPLIDIHRGGGQAALGNPNQSLLYPDNLLLLVADPIWAVNFRFWFHWLVAPFAFFWLCRRFGLDQRSSWAGAIVYATSGHFISQLNFYNLIAGVALAPALIAAVLEATRKKTRLRTVLSALAISVFWCLLILSGDPMTAVQAFVLAMLAWLISGQFGFDRKRDWVLVAAAFLSGTLLAAPQWLEFQKILGLSYRGHWGFASEWALQASWDPRRLAEWFLPLLFGRPDLGFWGSRFHDNNVPLFFSLYPGLLTVAFLAFSGRLTAIRFWRREMTGLEVVRLFSWLAVAGGVFFSLGRWNPVVKWLVSGGGASLRFPVKFWLPVAIGTALLAAVGFARTLASAAPSKALEVGPNPSPADDRQRLLRFLVVLAAIYSVAFVLLQFLGPQLENLIANLMPAGGPRQIPGQERLRLGGLTFFTAVFLFGFSAVAFLAKRRPVLGGSLLLALHVATQLFFLTPLLVTDERSIYEVESPLMSSVGEGELLVQSGFGKMFGPGEGPNYPGPQLHWVQRRGWAQLFPFVGTGSGVFYDLNVSPEGLDSFLTMTMADALEILDEDDRIRLLRAVGVDLLVLDRRLRPEALAQVRLRKHINIFDAGIYLYQLENSARELELVADVFRAENMNESVTALVEPTFNPRREVVLPGQGGWQRGQGAGTFELVTKGPESIRVRTSSAEASVLVWKRSHLPLYKATVDGEPVKVGVANHTRIGIEVGPGEHEVHVFADRSTLRVGYWLALLGLGLLPLIGWLGYSFAILHEPHTQKGPDRESR